MYKKWVPQNNLLKCDVCIETHITACVYAYNFLAYFQISIPSWHTHQYLTFMTELNLYSEQKEGKNFYTFSERLEFNISLLLWYKSHTFRQMTTLAKMDIWPRMWIFITRRALIITGKTKISTDFEILMKSFFLFLDCYE